MKKYIQDFRKRSFCFNFCICFEIKIISAAPIAFLFFVCYNNGERMPKQDLEVRFLIIIMEKNEKGRLLWH